MKFEVGSPVYLYLLLLLPLLVWWRYGRRKRSFATLKYSDTGLVTRIANTGGLWPRFLSPGLKLLTLLLIVLALVRPRLARTSGEETITQGIDIVLTLDISGSMRAEDFKPQNRLYVAKEVIKEFVQERPSDRLGLVVFSAQAFTQCPLTLDHAVLTDFLGHVTFGMVEDGTAIGTAIATSCNRLKDSPSKSKVIVLLTDGVNNSGKIGPVTAAEIAASLGIRIYTIGVGKPGMAPYPVDDPFLGRVYKYIPNALDEEVLTKVASLTGGKYYRAESTEQLKEIYKEISKLETSKIKTKGYVTYQELFGTLVLSSLGLLMVETVVGRTRFRKIP